MGGGWAGGGGWHTSAYLVDVKLMEDSMSVFEPRCELRIVAEQHQLHEGIKIDSLTELLNSSSEILDLIQNVQDTRLAKE